MIEYTIVGNNGQGGLCTLQLFKRRCWKTLWNRRELYKGL
jgi:hypothetical protein